MTALHVSPERTASTSYTSCAESKRAKHRRQTTIVNTERGWCPRMCVEPLLGPAGAASRGCKRTGGSKMAAQERKVRRTNASTSWEGQKK